MGDGEGGRGAGGTLPFLRYEKWRAGEAAATGSAAHKGVSKQLWLCCIFCERRMECRLVSTNDV